MDINYSMSEREFAVFAAAAGMPVFYGLPIEDQMPDDADLIECIHGMAKKKMLEEKGDILHLTQPYSRIFADIRRSSHVLTVRHKKRECPPKCIYPGAPGHNSWMTEPDSYAVSRIRIRSITPERLIEVLDGQGYLEEFGDQKRKPGKFLEGILPEGGLADPAELLKEPSCRMVLELLEIRGDYVKPRRELILLKDPAGCRMEVTDGESKKIRDYSVAALLETVAAFWSLRERS